MVPHNIKYGFKYRRSELFTWSFKFRRKWIFKGRLVRPLMIHPKLGCSLDHSNHLRLDDNNGSETNIFTTALGSNVKSLFPENSLVATMFFLESGMGSLTTTFFWDSILHQIDYSILILSSNTFCFYWICPYSHVIIFIFRQKRELVFLFIWMW